MFESRREWFDHELTTHRQKWHCNERHYTSTNRDEFKHHQKKLHVRDFTEFQILALVQACQRPVDSIELAGCPMCQRDLVQQDASAKPQPNTLSIADFRRHLGRQFEQLALFVLPRKFDEGEDKDCDSS